jgi:hypothetical protein
MRSLNAEVYTSHGSDSFIERIIVSKRAEMFAIFMKACMPTSSDTVLDAGVTADQKMDSSNFFEQAYSFTQNITALSDQNASWMETIYPGLKFVKGDVKRIPFENESFDWVFSSAVIEHVGDFSEQKRMLQECFRVARKGICITTPNRGHFMEFHTVLPFVHWLPRPVHRAILKKAGKLFFAHEDNLNLLNESELKHLCKSSGIQRFTIHKIRLFGFTSNLILCAHK